MSQRKHYIRVFGTGTRTATRLAWCSCRAARSGRPTACATRPTSHAATSCSSPARRGRPLLSPGVRARARLPPPNRCSCLTELGPASAIAPATSSRNNFREFSAVRRRSLRHHLRVRVYRNSCYLRGLKFIK